MSSDRSPATSALPGASDEAIETVTRFPPRAAANNQHCIVGSVLLAVFLMIRPVLAQESPARGIGARSCKASWQEGPATKKAEKSKKGSVADARANSGSACLEVHSTTLDVQEHLQAFVREQKWRVGEEEIGESFLSFSVALSKEELLGYTTPDTTTKRIEWRSGKAVVLVKTSDLSDGYTRTIVSAHFEGFGDADDSFAMKRASWTLNSNGRLEATLTSALQATTGAITNRRSYETGHNFGDAAENRPSRAILTYLASRQHATSLTERTCFRCDGW